jgi:hypothetical protein
VKRKKKKESLKQKNTESLTVKRETKATKKKNSSLICSHGTINSLIAQAEKAFIVEEILERT